MEKNDFHHPVCSFQDDFQEFEMIDDEDDDEEEEADPDAPPSPSASPPPSPTLGTLKSRPTTLNLTAPVSQVCLIHITLFQNHMYARNDFNLFFLFSGLSEQQQ